MASCPKPIKLVHVTTVPESLGFLAGHIAYQKDKGIEVHAVSSPGPLLERFGERYQIPVHAVPMRRRITPAHDLWALRQLCEVVKEVRPTIVHGHTPKGGLLAMLAASLCGTPARVYHIHGLPLMTARGLKKVVLTWSERVSCALADQVFCVSPSVARVAVARRLCASEKIKVLARGSIMGVDAERKFNCERIAAGTRESVRDRFGIPKDAFVIGFVGRIVRDKGFVELAGAWQMLREQSPDYHLLVVGPFEPQDPVPKEVETLLRNDSRVHLAGVDWETVSYYAAMDLFVLPSHREGFPSTPLEAAAMQLPVVATRIPGISDAVVDGHTGMLLPLGNARALANAIEQYRLDPELRTQHGMAGRRRVLQDFQPEQIWESLYQEYLRLVADNVSPELSLTPVSSTG